MMPAQRPSKRLDATDDVAVWNRHAKNSSVSRAFDVGLLAAAQHEDVDAMVTNQRAHHMTQLDPDPVWTGQRGEASY